MRIAAFTYIQATSTNVGAPTVDANHVVVTGLTGATQTIPGGFQVINAFSAFQIVSTPASSNSFVIVVPPTLITGAFTYTRRANSGLTYSSWTSTNLSPALLANPELFVRVQGQ